MVKFFFGLFAKTTLISILVAPLSGYAVLRGHIAEESPAALVGIVYNSKLSCTGTLLSPRVVMTAAHCFNGLSGGSLERYRVYQGLGVEGGRVRGPLLSIDDVLVHPNYDEHKQTDQADIALVILREPVVFPDPSDFPKLAVADRVAELRLFGYGRRSDMIEAGRYGTGRLATGVVTLRSLSELEAEIAVESPARPCSGDSGGPVFSGPSVVGVVSRGDFGCGESPSYLTLTKPFEPWIYQIIGLY